MARDYDFSGWATRCGIRCGDGKTIAKNAFKDDDGQTVPLVWQHQHDSPDNILGHAVLEHRDEGIYTYGYFNNSSAAQKAKELLRNGDIDSLSIYANHLTQRNGDVLHGMIREVSLVIAGANPGAYIDYVGLAHEDDGFTDEAVIFNDEFIEHDDYYEEDNMAYKKYDDEELSHADDETVKDVFETMSEKQQTAALAMVALALAAQKEELGESDDDEEVAQDDFDEGDVYMAHRNVFDQTVEETESNLMHSAIRADRAITEDDLSSIIKDGKRYGSLKESFLQHQDEYGIQQIDYLFPDAKNYTDTPGFIKRPDGWVSVVMNGVHRTPFTRIKSMFANITADEARAKGYTKGKKKIDEYFTMIKRVTTPQTIYKKNKLDRDDIIDITDFDVVAWLKGEMRMMLDEEIARAILVGDGRDDVAEDKIKKDNVRPIWGDDSTYTINVQLENPSELSGVAKDDKIAKDFIRAAIKSRKDYRGAGSPTLYTTEDLLTNMLLLEDADGRRLYDTEAILATSLRVSRIVTVPVMENLKKKDSNDELLGIIVNLSDYNVGSDKGGAINMFEDFDIDYNQEKYLIETRISGALVTPKSAITIELKAAAV